MKQEVKNIIGLIIGVAMGTIVGLQRIEIRQLQIKLIKTSKCVQNTDLIDFK